MVIKRKLIDLQRYLYVLFLWDLKKKKDNSQFETGVGVWALRSV